ncbi:MAG: methyltransferase [Vicinamibacterales bacterium]
MTAPTGVARWLADAEARHLADLTPAEVARALRALSSTYVERRERLAGRGAFDTAGKRAAYALYYAPRRFLMTAHVLAHLPARPAARHVLDAGCGTGAAGAAWAVSGTSAASVSGRDVHPWALDEARQTYAAFGLVNDVRRATLGAASDPLAAGRRRGSAPLGDGDAVVLSYTLNELDDASRTRILDALLEAAGRGARGLVIEPVSRRIAPWWDAAAAAVTAAGGRADEWRAPLELPGITAALGTAAGLDIGTSTARTLWL